MTRWTPALVILAGLVATAGAVLSHDLSSACVAALATVAYATSTPSTVGTTRLPDRVEPDPTAVRAWREAHPGATISEAIAAVSMR